MSLNIDRAFITSNMPAEPVSAQKVIEGEDIHKGPDPIPGLNPEKLIEKAHSKKKSASIQKQITKALHIPKFCIGTFLNLTKIAKSALNLIDYFQSISKNVFFFLKTTKLAKLILTPLVIIKFSNSVRKVAKEKTLGEKIRAGTKVIRSADKIVGNAVILIDFLLKLKAISDWVGCWIPYYDLIGNAITLLTIGCYIDGMFPVYHMSAEIRQEVNEIQNCTNEKEKVHMLLHFLDRLNKMGISKLGKKLSIAKEANFDKKIDDVRTSLSQFAHHSKSLTEAQLGDRKTVLLKASEFADILAKRAESESRFKLAFTAMKIVYKTAGIFASFLLTPLAELIVLMLLVTLKPLMKLSHYLLVRPNPFDPASRSPLEKAAEKIRTGVASGIDRMRNLTRNNMTPVPA